MTQRRKSLSEKDIQTVLAVFASIMEDNHYNWSKMNRFIGSMTLDEMIALDRKLRAWAYPQTHDPEDEGDYYDEPEDYGCTCDISGICGGPSCPQYYKCHA